ncbi:MAG: hypothetical protein WCL61_03255 [bacterium]
MRKKNILFSGVVVFSLVLFGLVQSVRAEVSTTTSTSTGVTNKIVSVIIPTVTEITVAAAPAEAMPLAVDKLKSVKVLKTRGNLEANQRINALNSLIYKIKVSKLTAEQKSTLINVINPKIEIMKNFKIAINASTDAISIKTQIRAIYEANRIYAVFIPAINLERALYQEMNHADKMDANFMGRIQVKIDDQKARGKDVTIRQKALDDAKLKLADTKVKIVDELTVAAALRPSDYQDKSKAVINKVRTEIKNINGAFREVRNNLINAMKPVK